MWWKFLEFVRTVLFLTASERAKAYDLVPGQSEAEDAGPQSQLLR